MSVGVRTKRREASSASERVNGQNLIVAMDEKAAKLKESWTGKIVGEGNFLQAFESKVKRRRSKEK